MDYVVMVALFSGPAAYVDYYADNYSTDGSLDFYFIFLREQSVEISGSDSQVCEYVHTYIHACV